MENQDTLVEKEEEKYGKFKSLDALLQAYNSLEAEFTRRSQKLKELESKVENLQQATEDTNASTSTVDLQNRAIVQTTQNTERVAMSSKDMHDIITDVVQECLHKHLQQTAPPILRDTSGFAKAPSQKVATLEEAGKLAEEFFKNIK